MASEDVNDQLGEQWRKILEGWAGKDAGGSRIVFPCIDGTPAPAGGRGIPQAVTNNALYNIGDALLTENNKWYTPDAKRSYFGEQKTYFQHILPTDNVNPANQEALAAAKNRESEAIKAVNKLRPAAFKEWKESQAWEQTDYNTFLINNRPDVLSAQSEARGATAQVNNLISQIYGPDSAEINMIKERFNTLFTNQELKGYSMKAATERFDVEDYIQKLQRGEKVDPVGEPSNTINLPSYEVDNNYARYLEDLYRAINDPKPAETKTIRVETGTSNTSSSSGSRTGGWGTDIFWWLRLRDGESENWSESTTNSTQGSVKIDVSIKDKKVITLTPGKWNVPGYRQKYPRVDAQAPESVKRAVKPVGMLLGSGLKYSISFEGNTKEAFNREYNKIKAGSGAISVFGITIYFGKKPEEEHEETHKSSFDSRSGVLTVEPKPQLGSAILLAMIGSKTDEA